MTHYSRSDILDRLVGQDRVTILLRESDTAEALVSYLDKFSGPGAVTFLSGVGPAWAFDPLADEDEYRCEHENAEGDRCMLIDGDHAQAHYYEED